MKNKDLHRDLFRVGLVCVCVLERTILQAVTEWKLFPNVKL